MMHSLLTFFWAQLIAEPSLRSIAEIAVLPNPFANFHVLRVGIFCHNLTANLDIPKKLTHPTSNLLTLLVFIWTARQKT